MKAFGKRPASLRGWDGWDGWESVMAVKGDKYPVANRHFLEFEFLDVCDSYMACWEATISGIIFRGQIKVRGRLICLQRFQFHAILHPCLHAEISGVADWQI